MRDMDQVIALIINLTAAEGYRVVRLLIDKPGADSATYHDIDAERASELVSAMRGSIADLDQATALVLNLRPQGTWVRDPRWYALLMRLSDAAMTLSLAIEPEKIILGAPSSAAGAAPAEGPQNVPREET